MCLSYVPPAFKVAKSINFLINILPDSLAHLKLAHGDRDRLCILSEFQRPSPNVLADGHVLLREHGRAVARFDPKAERGKSGGKETKKGRVQ